MLLHKEIERLEISTYSRSASSLLTSTGDRSSSSSSSIFSLSLASLMAYGSLGRDEVTVFQIEDCVTSARLFEMRLMLNFKNIIASTSPGVRDDHLGAMASFIPLRAHSYST